MAGRIIETSDSGAFSGDGYTLKYVVWQTSDVDEVESLVLNYAPETYRGVPRGKPSWNPRAADFFEVSVAYQQSQASPAPTGNNAGQDPGPIGSNEGGGNPASGVDPKTELGREMSFSTGGGTQRLYFALEHIADYAPTGKTAPNHRGAINVVGNDIQGVEVHAPNAEFTLSRSLDRLELGYFLRLLASTCCINSKIFLGFAASEVLLMGCDGNYKDGDPRPWKLSCKFGYSPNEWGITVGQAADSDHFITVNVKAGWDYLWVERETVEDASSNPKRMVQLPIAAHTERVYKQADFTFLGFS